MCLPACLPTYLSTTGVLAAAIQLVWTKANNPPTYLNDLPNTGSYEYQLSLNPTILGNYTIYITNIPYGGNLTSQVGE